MKKETNAQRVERIKREKDGLDVLADLYAYAASGAPVDPEDIDRFKWYGLYTQNRSHQEAGDDTLYFMLRVKLESGRLTPPQMKAVAAVSRNFAHGTADITTRQDIQFHWVQLKDLPIIFDRLKAVGLSTQMAAGDCPRNIVTCAVNDVDADRIADVSRLHLELGNLFRANKAFSNLPRKFKIGICGCAKHCISHEIQDLGFMAVLHGQRLRYAVSVGGGLAKGRRIATHIGYVEEGQVAEVARAVAALYNEHGNRDNRSNARVRHLVEQLGIAGFTAQLEARLGFAIVPGASPVYTSYAERSHFGIHPSIRAGESYIGCAVTNGRIAPDRLDALADLMGRYDVESLRCTTTQNIILCGVKNGIPEPILPSLHALGFDPSPSVFKARTLACTGLNFCKFAISETKQLSSKIISHLERSFPDFEEPVSISVNGCPNSCAHPYVVNIGLVGCNLKTTAGSVSGFELVLNGHLGGNADRFGIKTGIKITPEAAPGAIEKLIRDYTESTHASFRDYLDAVEQEF